MERTQSSPESRPPSTWYQFFNGNLIQIPDPFAGQDDQDWDVALKSLGYQTINSVSLGGEHSAFQIELYKQENTGVWMVDIWTSTFSVMQVVCYDPALLILFLKDYGHPLMQMMIAEELRTFLNEASDTLFDEETGLPQAKERARVAYERDRDAQRRAELRKEQAAS